jgi:bifunctional non-homologous end joining protein LigD
VERNITLYKREGSADKVYSLEMKGAADGLWDVTFRNARRGQPLKLAKSLPGLALVVANQQFDKQLKAKKADGYTEDQAGQAYTSSEFAGRASGLVPQLPKPIDRDQAQALLHDDAWALQEKANGENRMLIKTGEQLRGANKKGLFVDIPFQWTSECALLPDFEMAGEHVGDQYFAFDLLSMQGVDLRSRPFEERYAALEGLLKACHDGQHWSSFMDAPMEASGGEYEASVAHLREWEAKAPEERSSFKLLRAHFGPAKAKELARLEASNREGGVFKHLPSPYTPGYSDAILKFKFNESSACVVLAHNMQRSVQIGIIGEGGQMVPVGNVTIPANKAIPDVGAVAEVEYLYYNPGGAFEQPVFLRVRNDMDAAEALLSQVTRYKPEVLEQRQREREST